MATNISIIDLPDEATPGMARNLGMQSARGKYVAYLDAGDLFYDNHLDQLIDLLEAEPQRDFACARASVVRGEYIEGAFVPLASYVAATADRRSPAEQKASILVHRRLGLRRKFSFNEELPVLDAFDLIQRVMRQDAILTAPRPTVEIRRANDSTHEAQERRRSFWLHLIHGYYRWFSGHIALVRAAKIHGAEREAEECLGKVEAEYNQHLCDPDVFGDLLELVAGNGRRRAFAAKLARDYFKRAPRRCLQVVVAKKSTELAAAVLPYLPLTAARSIAGRCMRRFGWAE